VEKPALKLFQKLRDLVCNHSEHYKYNRSEFFKSSRHSVRTASCNWREGKLWMCNTFIVNPII